MADNCVIYHLILAFHRLVSVAHATIYSRHIRNYNFTNSLIKSRFISQT